MDLRDIVKAAEEQGWNVAVSKKGHPLFVPPDKRFAQIPFSGTPGDVRAIRNLISRMRQAGFIWPWAGRIKKK